MSLVLRLKILERSEERLGLLGRETVCSQPSYERALAGDVIRALANMPPRHLKLGLFSARRGHSRRLTKQRESSLLLACLTEPRRQFHAVPARSVEANHAASRSARLWL
ncbi:hypothetical protein [Methylobacterium sp. CM6257]